TRRPEGRRRPAHLGASWQLPARGDAPGRPGATAVLPDTGVVEAQAGALGCRDQRRVRTGPPADAMGQRCTGVRVAGGGAPGSRHALRSAALGALRGDRCRSRTLAGSGRAWQQHRKLADLRNGAGQPDLGAMAETTTTLTAVGKLQRPGPI